MGKATSHPGLLKKFWRDDRDTGTACLGIVHKLVRWEMKDPFQIADMIGRRVTNPSQ